MRIRADEHVSPKIVSAVGQIVLREGWEITSIREVGDVGRDDVYWITNFSDAGGDAILTADKDFIRREPQVNAVFDTGIRVIYLPSKWSQARGYLQAAHILQWWPSIERTLEIMRPRQCYKTQWHTREAGNLIEVRIDFEKYRKKKRRRLNRRR